MNKKIKEETKKKSSKSNIQKTGIIIILTGIVLLITIIFFKPNIDAQDLADNTRCFFNGIYTVLLSLLSTMITIGAGTVLYSFFDMVNYFTVQMEDTLIRDEYIDTLKREKKEKLKKQLERDLVYDGFMPEDNCLYSYVKGNVENIIYQQFFKEYNCRIYCTKTPEGYIEKRLEENLIYSQLDPNKEQNIDLNALIKCYFIPTSINIDDCMKLEQVLINGKDYTNEITLEHEEIEDDGTGYTLSFFANYNNEDLLEDLKLKDKDIHIRRVSISRVGITDKMFGLKVPVPCQRFLFSFYYNPCEFSAMSDVFFFMDNLNKKSENLMSMRNEKKTDNANSIDVEINDWMLPGDGLCIMLSSPDELKT